ncbi:MAG: NUDIX domain-containing protein [Burkholderiaceae bacterium]
MAPPASVRKAWLESLRQRAMAPSRAPRMELTVGDPPVRIGSVEASLAERMRINGLPLHAAASAWRVAGPLDASLAGIAQWLHVNGLSGPWRNELLPVTGQCFEPLGAIERAAVRPLGITTFAVHLIAARADGSVWVQQRARDKATDPGLWDTTMGGQVGAGESIADALARETWEEAGLTLAQLPDLRKVDRTEFRRPVSEGYLVEHIDVFEATLADAVIPQNQDGEVQGFECLALDALLERLLSEAFTLEAAVILAAWLQRRGLL